MLKGISGGLSSAYFINLLFGKSVEQFYVNGMREVFGIEVTIASLYILLALAGGISEILQTIRYCFKRKYTQHINKNGVGKSECIRKFKSSATVSRTANRKPTSTPSTPNVPSESKQI